MPIINLTGTQASRINEIEDRWVNFEANSNEKFYNYSLYSVPHGQTFASVLNIISGTAEISGAVMIDKRIHIFEDEVEAGNFINDVGVANISSYKEDIMYRVDGAPYKKIEVQLINYSSLSYIMELLNNTVHKGFKVEVFFSNSIGLKEVEKEPEFNLSGEIINDTYQKYFDITGK